MKTYYIISAILSAVPLLALPMYLNRHKPVSVKRFAVILLFILFIAAVVFAVNNVFIILAARDPRALSPCITLGIMLLSEIWCLFRYYLLK